MKELSEHATVRDRWLSWYNGIHAGETRKYIRYLHSIKRERGIATVDDSTQTTVKTELEFGNAEISSTVKTGEDSD